MTNSKILLRGLIQELIEDDSLREDASDPVLFETTSRLTPLLEDDYSYTDDEFDPDEALQNREEVMTYLLIGILVVALVFSGMIICLKFCSVMSSTSEAQRRRQQLQLKFKLDNANNVRNEQLSTASVLV